MPKRYICLGAMSMTLPIWRKICARPSSVILVHMTAFAKLKVAFVLKTELESNQSCTISLQFLKQPIIVLATDVWQLLFKLQNTQGNGIPGKSNIECHLHN